MEKNNNIIISLSFLIFKYRCKFEYYNDYGDYYIYSCFRFKVYIYEWQEKEDLDINLIVRNENYHIELNIEEPLKYAQLRKKKKGLKGLFFDYNRYFWKLAALVIKKKIKFLIEEK